MKTKLQRISYLVFVITLSQCSRFVARAGAQAPVEDTVTATQDAASAAAAQPASQQQPHLRGRIDPLQMSWPENKITVHTGVRVPLLLRNGINTRTAKPGDSVYFETFYPIAQNDRIVIPMGSFMRGHVVETKRPGRIKGRGEIRILIDSLTFSNGYTPELRAIPNSADTDGKTRVDSQGKIRGRSGLGQDVATIGATTLGGFYAGSYVGLLSAFSKGSALTGVGIGTGVGAAAGLAMILLTRGPEAELPRGTMLDVVFDRPLILDADRLPANEPGRLSLGLEPANSQSNEGQRSRASRHGRFPF